MLIALQVCVALALTATLLTVGTVLTAFELGRLATRDDEQRQPEAADAPQIREDARLGICRHAMRRGMTLVLITVLATFGRASLIHAEAPHGCRNQCSVELENCRDGCVESGGFNGCEEECGPRFFISGVASLQSVRGAAYEGVVLQAFQDVEDALAGFSHEQATHVQLEDAVRANERAGGG